jgi:uncharacterized protein with GYD domain
MATYVLMTKLAPNLMDPGRRKQFGREWKEAVDRLCPEVKWIGHYALLGPYDFLDLYEAPNEEVAAKVSMITHAAGAQKAESWPAIPYQRFLQIAEKIGETL